MNNIHKLKGDKSPLIKGSNVEQLNMSTQSAVDTLWRKVADIDFKISQSDSMTTALKTDLSKKLITKKLIVNGLSVFYNDLYVVNGINISGDIYSQGNAYFLNGVSVDGSLAVGRHITGWEYIKSFGNSITDGNSYVSGNLYVSGTTDLYNNLGVSGVSNLYNTLNVTGITNLYNTLNVSGNFVTSGTATLKSNINVSGSGYVSGSIRIGDDTDKVIIDNVSGIRLYGNATVYDDVQFPLTTAKLLGSSDPTFSKISDNGSGSTGIYAYLFSDTFKNEVFVSYEMPHYYKEGSDFNIHLHYYPETNDSGNIIFEVESVFNNVDSVLGNSTVHQCICAVPSGSAKKHMYQEIATINGSNLTISHGIGMRVARRADLSGDTYPGKCWITRAALHIEVDSLGSRTESSK